VEVLPLALDAARVRAVRRQEAELNAATEGRNDTLRDASRMDDRIRSTDRIGGAADGAG
jgi:hypothetical protein